VAYAGGGFLSAKKGDGVWLFGLDGAIGELPPMRGGTQPAVPPTPPAGAPTTARAGDAARGEPIYKAACVYCHGEQGKGGEGGGKAIAPALGVEGIRAVLASGRDKMPAFGAAMTPEQLQDVATYVDGLVRTKR
jgi:mono/diheme cytochrome c family protein